MKQIRYRFIYTALAAVALLVAGCSKESQGEGITDGTYLSLSVDGVKAANSARSGSRATAVDESVVNDLWVLQFQMTAGSTTVGTLVDKTYMAFVADPTKIKFSSAGGDNMVLYLVVNSGNSELFSATTAGATLATVKAMSISATTTAGNNFPTEMSTNLPMVGQSATLTLPSTTAVPITLTRAVSKIVLTIKNPLATVYPQLTVSSVQLKNVPKVYSTQVVNVANGFTGATYFPVASASNFGSYTAVAGDITAAGKSFMWFVAPNVRGVGSNTDDRLKSDLTAPAGQGDFCTYVEIFGTAKASATAPVTDVRYRLYLGANSTNNFNLEANIAYTVHVELTGINGNDARMRITTDQLDLTLGSTDGDHSEDIGGWEKPSLPAIGAFKDGGVVFWIDPADKTKYKVVSLVESKLLWYTHSNSLGPLGEDNTDGRINVARMKEYAAESGFLDYETLFPAAYFCDNLGDGWYLPARTELQYLRCTCNGNVPKDWGDAHSPDEANIPAQEKFNSYLHAAGGTVIDLMDFHWTSTHTARIQPYTISFWGGVMLATPGNQLPYLTRCIKSN